MMFHVTNVNLSADARHGDTGAGPRRTVEMSGDALVALLEVFAEIDAHENNEADAEIRVESRKYRFVVRTAQKKLFLHNPRDLAEPAYVLSAREIVAELDGSAAQARLSTPPVPVSFGTEPKPSSGEGELLNELPPRRVADPPSFPFVLLALVVALGGYAIYAEFFVPHWDPRPVLTPLSGPELVAEESVLIGSYMTGIEPGQHGIVVMAGGKLELFQVNARGGPGIVYGVYTLGRNDKTLNLNTDQPGGLIKVISRDALEFCGETYKRVQAR
jgi:hypothetical protein